LAVKIHPDLRSLDVTVLHRLVFEECWRHDPILAEEQGDIVYYKDVNSARSQLAKGEGEWLVWLNAARVEDVFRVARAGQFMPQKSTFFYPKIISGLVTQSFES
jgi:uncharacterized protein (DUF1015 family)